jgi:ATP adenylyltransferase
MSAMAKKTKTKSSGSKSKSASSTKTAPRMNSRQVMFRPDRLKYVRKLVRPEGCVFCTARESGVSPKTLVVAVQGEAMIVMNKYPYNAGHLLVLPRRHVGKFEDLTLKEAEDIFRLQQKALHALEDLYSPGGFNMGLNLGASAGAGIPDHLHWHLIPRWSGDANFFPLIAETKVVIETLEQTYERLVPYFS